MRSRVSARTTSVLLRAAAGLFTLALAGGTATAQTTVTLDSHNTDAWAATVRGGTYANTNNTKTLETRAASDLSYRRHALLKFDTQNKVPKGSNITSAILTMTVRDGSDDSSRRIGVYQVTESWEEPEVTWNRRKSGIAWHTPGATLGTQLDVKNVSNAPGSKVSWDVTALVRQAVAGQLGSSRYTRLALADLDSPTNESWRGYYTPNDASGLRPTLTVTYGGATSTASSTSTSGYRLRVLHWNIAKNGWGTDGRYDPNRVASWIAKMNPEVISLNEVEAWNSYSQGEDGVALYKSLLTQKMGGTWYVWQAQDYGNWSDKGLRNVIYSRYPFTSTYRTVYSAGKLKAVGGVTIHVNGRTINFMTTHFDPYSYDDRQIQARDLRSYASGFAEDRIICGDFNEQAGNLTTISNYYWDAWAAGKSAGIAYSAPDNPNGYTRNSRIDYIFYSRNKRYISLKKVQVVDTRDSNGEMPSDHRPIYAEFQVQ